MPSIHQNRRILFQDLFDVKDAQQRISFRIAELQERQRCRTTFSFVPEETSGPAFASDPFPNVGCIQFVCAWGIVRMATPPSLFPRSDTVYFFYNRVFQAMAQQVIAAIQKQVAEKKNDEFRIITMHIRRGDRVVPGVTSTWPMFDCSSEQVNKIYPHQVYAENSVFCTSSLLATAKVQQSLTWPRLFEHMANESCSDAFPICAHDFDAMYIATDDPQWVQQQVANNALELPPAFFIGNFSSLLNDTLPMDHSAPSHRMVEVLLVEQLILVHSLVYVPSFPSSITQQTLRLRLAANSGKQREKLLYDTYTNYSLIQQWNRLQQINQ